MTAYYNEIDPFAAAWLRELIANNQIAPGYVDERSIEDVTPSDLEGFTQCHFFAGIGGWSYALRLAGWPDDRPVWTGSCPCQPFSSAGKGKGFADERHLWPSWYHLITQSRPKTIFGEQVAKKDGLGWLDLVQSDLEGMEYACGAVVIPAAGFGAPEIRERLYWVACADSKRSDGIRLLLQSRGQIKKDLKITRCGKVVRMADPEHLQRERCVQRSQINSEKKGVRTSAKSTGYRTIDGLVDSASGEDLAHLRKSCASDESSWQDRGRGISTSVVNQGRSRPVKSFWEDADWLFSRDGFWRSVEPGTFPLADRLPGDLEQISGYGNAIVPQQAQAFIEAYSQ